MAKLGSKVVPLNSSLHELLVTENMNNFTVLELRDRFLELTNDIKPDKARLYVYRHLARLQKLGCIEKKHAKSDDKPIYSKTERFVSMKWNLHKGLSAPPTKANKKIAQQPPVNALKAELERAEKDFIACIEESKTYVTLAKQYPFLADQLAKAKKLAEQQSAKLVGEIRAFKMALEIHD
ncbi:MULTISPECIES: hypothetical protein [Vibrio]|uniref:hypothetical protein n=1 Tax=Vibrio TaxID=662 RepID=UPI000365DEFE|nr:hypothetical protein [Vibrio crassostreae]OEE89407.1 hypothetical protein A140_18695 [Vibrio crassostreae 9ZC88]